MENASRPIDEEHDPVTWELRFEVQSTPEGSWRKKIIYVYGTCEQAASFVASVGSRPDHCLLSMTMKPKIRRFYDLTDPG
jgi:hypothetical protein